MEENSKYCIMCGAVIPVAARFCNSCGVTQGASFQGKPRSPDGSKIKQRPNIWVRPTIEFALPLAISYLLLTTWDSIFWLTWTDPFVGANGFAFATRNLLEWGLPTLAVVLLIFSWQEKGNLLLLSGLVCGGLFPVILDFWFNSAILGYTQLQGLLGIWENHDFFDLLGQLLFLGFGFRLLQELRASGQLSEWLNKFRG